MIIKNRIIDIWQKNKTRLMYDKIDENKLDNPVWNSLSEMHQNFSVNYEGIKYYNPKYCPFGGFETPQNISSHIDLYSTLVDDFFIVGNKPPVSNHIEIKKELVCLQMIIEDKVNIEVTEDIIATTNENDLFQLINLVQPGYFKEKTNLLGDYFGIYKNEQLIAVTGERMKMNDFTEVSAIVTHPSYVGQGYAKQLISHAVNNIFHQNKIPYLHVLENNIGAIKLYEKLGFKTRRKMSFWNIGKQ
jgi:GNAT superfamily N-acetyltransferase